MRQTTVATVMTTDPVTVTPDTAFKDIVAVLTGRAISAVPVVDDHGTPIGVVSEADLLVRTEHQPEATELGRLRRHRHHDECGRTAAELMTPNPLTIRPDASLPEAARILATAGVRRVLVVDDAGRLVGVVARRDLLSPFLLDDERIRAAVVDEVLWQALWLKPTRLTVEVDHGVVTLTGTVERRSEAELAVRLTDALPGVVAVSNQLHYTWNDIDGSLGTSNLLH